MSKTDITKSIENELLIDRIGDYDVSIDGSESEEVGIAKEYLDKALSENTKRAYSREWDRFSVWCLVRKLEFLPAEPISVARFISWMAKRKKKVSTICRYLASISKAHRVMGHDSPTRTEIVGSELAGIKRENGVLQDQVDPLEIELVRKIATGFSVEPLGIRNKALLLTGYFCALRRSELVNILHRDVKFIDGGATVLIRHSKTDKIGKGEVIPLTLQDDKEICPVLALTDWMLLAPKSKYLFCHLENAKGTAKEGDRLSDKMIARLIQRWCAALGIEGKFSGHSLRAGFITSAAKRGKSYRSIMKTSRHKSHAMVDRYVRNVGILDDNAGDGIDAALPKHKQ